MFLPDRYIKGECPNCGAKDQYGDNCEVCGAVYAPTDLKNPYSALSGATPVLKSSEHYFFQLSHPRCVDFLQAVDARPAGCSPRWLNKIKRVVRAPTTHGHVTLADWDISRDAPYFGIEIPDAPGKYFYVWLDAPVGYLASLKNHSAAVHGDATSTQFMADPSARADPLHRQGHRLPSTRCSGRRCCTSAGARRPTSIYVHGFITLGGEKMSKSRGTGISPLRYLELGLNAEWLRYYIAAKLNAQRRGHRLQPRRLRRARQQRPGRQVHQHRQPRGRLPRQALRRPAVGRPRRRGPHAARRAARAPRRGRAPVRGARVRQGAARDDAAGRPRQRVRRPEQALGAGQAAGHGGAPARRLQRLHRGLPRADDLPEAGAAGAGRAGRGLPEGRAAGLRRRRTRARRRTRSASTST